MSISKIKTELIELELEHEMARKMLCSKEENAEILEKIKNNETLPGRVFRMSDSPEKFFRISNDDLTPEEKKELLLFKQLKVQQEIRSWVKFFGILTIIGLILGVIFAIIILCKSCI